MKVVRANVDITEREKGEESLIASNNNCWLLTENRQDLVEIWDVNGVIQYASRSHERLLGIPPDICEGKTVFNLVHPDDIPNFRKQYNNMVLNKTSTQVEFRYKHAQDYWVFIEAWGTPVMGKDGEVDYLLIEARDITERKKREKLLLNSDKLFVIEQLAAVFAHKIRNPLTTIRGFIQLLQKEVNKPFYTNILLSEIRQLEIIINDLLTLAKPKKLEIKKVNAKTLIDQVIALFKSQEILNHVEIIQEYCSDLPLIYCDATLIKQVFKNILENAVDAMPEGGTIKIQTNWDSDCIQFRFIDSGNGISEERLKNIGQPFYSIKEKGTGFGLTLAMKIAHEHGGNISIVSKINMGTIVDFILPIKDPFLIN
jgi:PAS domain S-box-containing protein